MIDIEKQQQRIIQMENELDSLSAELLQSYQELNMHYTLPEKIGVTVDIYEICNIIIDVVVEHIPSKRASIMLYEDGREKLVVQASHGMPSELGQHPSINLKESIVQEVMRDGKPLLIDDLRDHPHLKEYIRPGVYETSSILSVPLLSADAMFRQEVVGTINLSDKLDEKRHYTSMDLKLLTALASQLGVAIKRAQLFEDLKRSERGLEEKIKERTLQLEESNRELAVINNELKIKRIEAEAANSAKSAFLANMSHEIRTPMNAILGLTGLAMDMATNSEQRDYLSMVKQASESLLTIINDILDFSKIEAGRLDLECIDFTLEETIKGVLDTFSFQSRKKGLLLQKRIAPDVHEVLKGDPMRLRQVLLNIVGNAMKFTDKGSILLEVKDSGEGTADAPMLLFSVSDTGIGIPVDKRDKIFKSFSQADSSTSRKYGGTGLGLTISVNLVKMMGGRIWVESEAGKGSTFHFTARLPAGDPEKVVNVASESLLPSPVRPLRILLAEDNPLNQILAVRLLEKHGHAVTIAENGKEALSILSEKEFDVILMDAQMPEMDGYETTKSIRSGVDILNTNIPIIAMTANVMEGDREACLAAGMDDYVSKPIRVLDLMSALGRQVTTKDGSAADTAEAVEAKKELHIVSARALELLDWDETLYREICGMFLAHVPDNMREIQNALHEGDIGAAHRKSHALKSISGSVGAEYVQEIAAAIEDACEKQELEGVTELLSRLELELERAYQELRVIVEM